MNCANHPEAAAVAYCRECGKPMCEECRRPALGSVYCAEHLEAAEVNPSPASFLPPPPPPPNPAGAPPPRETPSPYAAPVYPVPPDLGPNPVVAFALGFIPGVGAIYNGQYAKGLIHALVFGLLVSVADQAHGTLQTLSGIGIAVWIFYMAFEAYHTARNRRYGVPVEEFSSLFDTSRPSRLPGGPLLLIGLGILLLLDTTDVINLDQLERYWPVGLILLGFYLLFVRLRAQSAQNGNRTHGETSR